MRTGVRTAVSREPVRFFDTARLSRGCRAAVARLLRGKTARMHIIDARHFLDDKGAIAPLRGPAKAMADFHAVVIACATKFDETGVTLPRCVKCKKGTVARPRSQLAGERNAVAMSLLQSAKLNGHEPWACLKDVLPRLPTQLNSRIEGLWPIAAPSARFAGGC